MPSLLIIKPADCDPQTLNSCRLWLDKNEARFRRYHPTLEVAEPTDEELNDAHMIVVPRLTDLIPLAGREMSRRNFHVLGTSLDTRQTDQSAGGRRQAMEVLEPLVVAMRQVIESMQRQPEEPEEQEAVESAPAPVVESPPVVVTEEPPAADEKAPDPVLESPPADSAPPESEPDPTPDAAAGEVSPRRRRR